MKSLTRKILRWIHQDLFLLLCSAGIALWWLFCHFVRPTVPIYIDEGNQVYLPIVGVISMCILALPVIVYLCRHEFRELRWQEQLQSTGIVLMLGSIVFRPSVYLHVQVAFFTLAAVAFLFGKEKRWYKQPAFYYACWLYVIWLAVSMIWTHNNEESVRYLNRIVPLASYSFTFAFIHLSNRNYRLIIRAFWCITCLACILTIASGIYEAQRMGIDFTEFIQFKKSPVNGLNVYNILYAWSGTGHPSYNALWIMAGLACSFFLLDRHMISTFDLLFSCLLMLLVVIITQSRVGTIMWSLITLFGVIYVLRHKKYALWSTLIFLGIVSLAVGITQLDMILSIYSDPSRAKLTQIAIDYLRIDPWKGCGLGGMTYEYLEGVIGYEFKSWWPQYDAPTMYPHNQFLGDWVQSGIVGLVLSLSLVICGFYDAIRQHNYIGVAYLTAVFFFMLIEMPFHFLGGSTIIAFFLCLILSHRAEPTTGITQGKTPCDFATRTK